MANFTPLSALAGGALIGLAAALYLLGLGRVAGVSGILGNLLRPTAGEAPAQLAFVAGLIAAPLLMGAAGAPLPTLTVEASLMTGIPLAGMQRSLVDEVAERVAQAIRPSA